MVYNEDWKTRFVMQNESMQTSIQLDTFPVNK